MHSLFCFVLWCKTWTSDWAYKHANLAYFFCYMSEACRMLIGYFLEDSVEFGVSKRFCIFSLTDLKQRRNLDNRFVKYLIYIVWEHVNCLLHYFLLKICLWITCTCLWNTPVHLYKLDQQKRLSLVQTMVKEDLLHLEQFLSVCWRTMSVPNEVHSKWKILRNRKQILFFVKKPYLRRKAKYVAFLPCKFINSSSTIKIFHYFLLVDFLSAFALQLH